MKNYIEIANKCMDILDSLLIDYHEPKSITVNNRLTRAIGQCKKRFTGNRDYWGKPIYTYWIELNPAIVEDTTPDIELENTLLHELLHTVDDCWDHTGKWKRLAETVNKEYGYSIRRTNTYENVAARYEAHNQFKYICACPKCGYEWKYKRWCKAVENPERYLCRDCNEHLYLKWHDPKIQIWGLNPTFKTGRA